jgi:hypothetical protein
VLQDAFVQYRVSTCLDKSEEGLHLRDSWYISTRKSVRVPLGRFLCSAQDRLRIEGVDQHIHTPFVPNWSVNPLFDDLQVVEALFGIVGEMTLLRAAVLGSFISSFKVQILFSSDFRPIAVIVTVMALSPPESMEAIGRACLVQLLVNSDRATQREFGVPATWASRVKDEYVCDWAMYKQAAGHASATEMILNAIPKCAVPAFSKCLEHLQRGNPQVGSLC